MASTNIVVVVGKLTRDPEARKTPSGASVCDFSIAINERVKKDGTYVEHTTYVDVTCWGNTADACGRSLTKGSSVLCEGKLQLDQWEKDGQKRSKMRVRADRVTFLDPRRDRETAAGEEASSGELPI